MMPLLPRTPAGALRLIVLGLALQVLGQVWDLRWHAANPGVLETAGALWRAHGGIFLGVVVLLAGGVAGVAWSRQPATDPRLRGWLLVVLVGAAVQAAGVARDSWRHSHGDQSTVGHLLAYLGVLAALIATVVAAWLQPDRRVTT